MMMRAVNVLGRHFTASPLRARPTCGAKIAMADSQIVAKTLDGPESLLVANRYDIKKLIGIGSLARVYQVEDRQTNLAYTLKLFEPPVAKQVISAKRLEHEATAWKDLNHSNIVAVYDVGITAHGALYIVTDHNAGGSLQRLLQKEVLLGEERALNIFIQITEALAYAHANGRTHRNLKPGNIIINKTASGHDIVKISDFGIAKSISDHSIHNQATIEQIAEIIANPNYMSPEQCVDDELDGRTDIYSLGCIMYEAVTGNPPFCHSDVVRVMVKHLSETPSFPSNTKITVNLKQIIMRCLRKNPAARYSSAQALLLDLQNLNDQKLSRQICSVSPPQFPSSFRALVNSLRTVLLCGQSKRVF